jgi:AcrR family transcriptional regulator
LELQMTTTRDYSSPSRAATAARTRRLIVESAAELFVRDGYVATTMQAIASRAGVSVQSVNLAGPKSALLIAAFETAFAGDEGRHSLTERPALQEIMGQADTEAVLDAYARFLSDANRRSAAIIRVMRTAADADVVVRAAFTDLERRRARDMRLGAEWMVNRDLIQRPSIAEAADVLGYLTGPDTYLVFVEDRGWTPERYETWLHRAIRTLILGVY